MDQWGDIKPRPIRKSREDWLASSFNNNLNKIPKAYEVANEIASTAFSTMRNIALHMLTQQNQNDQFYAFIGGGVGFEEIIDKNRMNDVLLPSDDIDLIISGSNDETKGFSADNTVDHIICNKMRVMVETIDIDTITPMFRCLLYTINQALLKAEMAHNISLKKVKPKIKMWETVRSIFQKDRFIVSQREAADGKSFVFSIVLRYFGLGIPIMECGNKIINIKNHYTITRGSYMKLLNRSWYAPLLKVLTETPSYPKKTKALARLTILEAGLVQTPAWSTNAHLQEFHPNNGVPVHVNLANHSVNNHIITNSQQNISSWINTHTGLITAAADAPVAADAPAPADIQAAIVLYGSDDYRPINAYLLQYNLFKIGKNKSLNLNDASGRVVSVTDIVAWLDAAFTLTENIGADIPRLERRILADVGQYATAADAVDNMQPFHTIRFTNQSVINRRVIEQYRIGEILNVPTYLSTSHTMPLNADQYTSMNSPSVIFRFFISRMSKGKFMFMQQFAALPQQYEVLLRRDNVYQIIDKYYITVEFNGVYIQKLTFDLIIYGDREALQYYNTTVANMDQQLRHVQPYRFGPEILNNEKYASQVAPSRPDRVKDNRRKVPDRGIHHLQVPVNENIPYTEKYPGFVPGQDDGYSVAAITPAAPFVPNVVTAPTVNLGMHPYIADLAEKGKSSLTVFANLAMSFIKGVIMGGGEENVDFISLLDSYLCNDIPAGQEGNFIKLDKSINNCDYLDREILEFVDRETQKKYNYEPTEMADVTYELEDTTAEDVVYDSPKKPVSRIWDMLTSITSITATVSEDVMLEGDMPLPDSFLEQLVRVQENKVQTNSSSVPRSSSQSNSSLLTNIYRIAKGPFKGGGDNSCESFSNILLVIIILLIICLIFYLVSNYRSHSKRCTYYRNLDEYVGLKKY